MVRRRSRPLKAAIGAPGDNGPLPPSRKQTQHVRLGIAGWQVPRELRTESPQAESQLSQYAAIFNCVEINSSFRTSHARSTYERWRRSVPGGFRFSVKAPQQITHELRLRRVAAEVDLFAQAVMGLGTKLGPVLVQLPPSLEFAKGTVNRFFAQMSASGLRQLVCEPRHASWSTPAARLNSCRTSMPPPVDFHTEP